MSIILSDYQSSVDVEIAYLFNCEVTIHIIYVYVFVCQLKIHEIKTKENTCVIDYSLKLCTLTGSNKRPLFKHSGWFNKFSYCSLVKIIKW